MKLVFIINRIDTYRFFSTLINEGINRGNNIEIWHNYSNEYKLPLIEKSPFFNVSYEKVKFIKLLKKKSLTDFIRMSEAVDYFVSLNPVEFQIDKNLSKKIDGKWCIIQHGHDSFSTIWDWQAFNFDGDLLQKYSRLFFAYSDFFYDERVKWIKRNSKSYEYNSLNYTFFTSKFTKVIPIGSTLFDNSLLNLEKANIYHKYKISPEKNVFLYLPFIFYPPRSTYGEKGTYSWQVSFTSAHRDFRGFKEYLMNFKIKHLVFLVAKKIIYFLKMMLDKEARTWLLSKWNEEAVLKSVKLFCDKNNMVLVVKSKSQVLDPYNSHEYSNNIIEDEGLQNYPSKLQELISISSIVLGFQTSAVSETVIGKAHHINLECPDSNLAYNKTRLENHHTKVGGKNNFPGVVSNFKIPEFISKFPYKSIDDFKVNTIARKKYMEKHTGKSCEFASERFYETLENNN